MRTGILWGMAAAFGASLALAQPSFAVTATYDFEAIGDGAAFMSTLGAKVGAEGNWNKTDSAGSAAIVGDGAGIIVNGITVYAEGGNSSGAAADAFFDAGRAGLGVCSSASCKSGVPGAITSDDNLNRAEESLKLMFDRTVSIAAMTVRRANHSLANGNFTLGGVVYSIINGMVDADALALISPGAEFSFGYIPGGPELYLSDVTVAAVPLPATAALLSGAFGLLGWRARKQPRA
jgi:hypothetical protein